MRGKMGCGGGGGGGSVEGVRDRKASRGEEEVGEH